MSRRDKGYGPVTDPHNTDWTAWSKRWRARGWSQEAIDNMIRRRVAKSRMLRFRSVPVKRRAWYVTLTATLADQERDFGSHDLAAGLTFEPQAFWCLSRRKAKKLVQRDLAANGSGTLYPVDYRLCVVCSRVLLGPDAHEYRMKQMKPASTWHFKQGPACNMDCKPKGRGPNGQPMRYKRRIKAA